MISHDENIVSGFFAEYGFMSNFYYSPITYKGLPYFTAEAAFQAQKCINEEDKYWFSKERDAGKTKRKGRRIQLRSDWEDIKIKVMRDVVLCKFSQHENLKEKLINTYPKYLEERNWWGDDFWGVYTVENGKNYLGHILMETRSYLRRLSKVIC